MWFFLKWAKLFLFVNLYTNFKLLKQNKDKEEVSNTNILKENEDRKKAGLDIKERSYTNTQIWDMVQKNIIYQK